MSRGRRMVWHWRDNSAARALIGASVGARGQDAARFPEVERLGGLTTTLCVNRALRHPGTGTTS